MSENKKLALPMLPMSEPSQLERHPKNDGFRFADPYPMSEGYRRMLRKQIELVCPPPPAPWSDEILDACELHVRGFMRYMPALVARGLWLTFLFLDFLPLLLFKSSSRLHRMDRESATRFMDAVASAKLGPLRMAVVGVRGSILSAYFDQTAVHEAIDYRPQPFIRSRMELREQLLVEATPIAAE